MITRNTAYSNGTHYKRIPAFSLLIAWTTLALRRFWRHSPLLSPLLTPEHGASAFSIQLELADLIALGILPWKGGRKKKLLARAPGFLISSLSLRCIGAFSLVSPPLCGTQSWPVPTTHCLCVCVCVHGAVISMRKECREWTGAAFSFCEMAADKTEGAQGRPHPSCCE